MVPWDLIIGGLIGVGGTSIGAIISGRYQVTGQKLTITNDRDEARRADKRHVYAACQAAFTDMQLCIQAYREASQQAAEDGIRRQTAERQLAAARKQMLDSVGELILVAPKQVCELAGQIQAGIIQLGQETDDSPRRSDPRAALRSRRAEMLDAMRDDLGESFPPDTAQAVLGDL